MLNREQNSQFNLLSEISQDIFFCYDPRTKIIRIPASMANKVSLRESYSLLSDTFMNEHIYKDDQEKFSKFFEKPSYSNIKFRLKIKDGKYNWYQGTISKSLDYDGIYRGYFRDINQEVCLEQEKEHFKVLNVIQHCLLKAPYNKEGFKFLGYLATYLKADQIFIAMYNPDLKIEYTSSANIFPKDESLCLLDKKYLKHSDSISVITDMEDYKNIDSFIEIPLIGSDNSVIGIMGIVNAKKQNINGKTLSIFSTSLSIAMQNILHNKDLEKHISRDLLTGVKNRNAYETYLDNFGPNSLNSLGIMVVDINGLKACNDTKGHNAGDLLIKSVAKDLSSMFGCDNIYRFGGDEFIVICENIEEDILLKKIALYKLKSNGVSASIGHCFRNNNINIDEMQKEADKRMYLEKERYYQQHPNRRKN